LVPAPRRERCATLLVMGGSQGARTLNRALTGCLRDMLDEHERLHVVHQCGARDADEVHSFAEALHPRQRERYTMAPFFGDMAARIAEADVVLMRAGGSSLAECAALGRAMILVPYPHAGGHQLHNVLPYVSAGAAAHMPDSECTPERVRHEVGALMHDTGRWRAMSEASEAMGRPDAADHVVQLVREAAASRVSRRAP
jgi:UDP-N-acetylglucosamine--N-acetylmuramyl-(pentapeptide) pyrophosphoryl-undecaprenol N-acetylglucosamine transferase